MRVALKYQLTAALIFLFALILVNPLVESGMNDDWSFVRTALDLAQTGHLKYNGWSAPLIGFQAYWGALFIKLFGFSFLAVRASVWLLTLLFIPVGWELFRSAGLSESHSFFGLVMFLLSPLNLPNLTTFMTDMPAFILFGAALLSALKAYSAERKTFWICATTICALLSGSVRQVYWLSGICFLVVLAAKHARSRALIAVCLACILAFGWWCSHWLAQQPYVPADITRDVLHDNALTETLQSSGLEVARFCVGVAVLSIPFSVLFASRAIRRIPLWVQLLIAAASAEITYLLARPLPWLGNIITQNGILLSHTVSLGEKPEVLTPVAIFLLASVGLFAAALALSELKWDLSPPFVLLTLPFLLGYIATLAFRSLAFGLYDRYIIPVVFLLATMAMIAHSRFSSRVGVPSWIVGLIFAFYAVATTHDYFAEGRAKLQASESILRSSQTRDTILNGFEYDCWTQVQASGHINNDLLKRPGEYVQMDDCDGPDDAQAWWRSFVPRVQARYILSLTPLKDMKSSGFTPVAYWRWLPPQKGRIYISEINPPLSCKPDAE